MKLNFLFVVLLLSFFLSFSCSKNNTSEEISQNEESVDTENTTNIENANTDSPIKDEQKTKEEVKPNSPNPRSIDIAQPKVANDQENLITDENPENQDKNIKKYNYKLIKKKYKLSKNTFDLINSNMLEFTALNRDYLMDIQSYVPEENNEEVVEEGENNEKKENKQDIEEEQQELFFPIIISTFSIKDNLDEYIKSYLPNYIKVAESKFTSSKKITLDQIKHFGAYITTDLALVKSFTETSNGKFVYNIVFLTGDILNEQNYWYRNIEESLDMAESLKRLKITDINDYANVMTSKEKDEMQKKQKSLEKQSESVNNPEGNNLDNKENLEEELIDLEIKLQKKLIEYRVEKLIGLWQDINTNDVYEIREIKNKKNNISLYAGYLFYQESENSEPPILPKLLINSNLDWLPKDLKFEFLGTDGDGFYITEEKMLAKARIIGYPFKGYIIIQLPNGHLRYLVPLIDKQIADVVYDGFYSEILQHKVSTNIEEEHLYSYKIGTKSTKGVDSFSIYWIIPLGLFIGLSFL